MSYLNPTLVVRNFTSRHLEWCVSDIFFLNKNLIVCFFIILLRIIPLFNFFQATFISTFFSGLTHESIQIIIKSIIFDNKKCNNKLMYKKKFVLHSENISWYI